MPGLGPEAGAALASDPDINQLTFTGSVEVGILVAKMAADNIVPVVMELGGKSPNIVFADADLDLTVQGVANAIFQNAGQTCSAGSRLLVERKAHDALVDRLIARAGSMRIGPGVSDPDMGPIISKRQLETVEGYVTRRRSQRARRSWRAARGRRTRRLAAASFSSRRCSMACRPTCASRRKRYSAPCSRSRRSTTSTRRPTLANRSDYGLVAGIWTRDINKAMALASRIKTGQVYVNTYGAGGGVELPFGGYKKSGYGREKGLESLAELHAGEERLHQVRVGRLKIQSRRRRSHARSETRRSRCRSCCPRSGPRGRGNTARRRGGRRSAASPP